MGCFYVYGSHRGFVDNVKTKEDILIRLTGHNILHDIKDVYILHNGKVLQSGEELINNQIYHVVPRLVGGKGGFGSMLRAIGAQIEKTTSREACRDLSGRRMRDVNNEKKLKDWLSKQADREREKEEKRKERMERRRNKPRHQFDDPTYVEQKNKVVEDLEDALQRGLEKAKVGTVAVSTDSASGSGYKRKADQSDETIKSKKTKGWLGLDPSMNLSDLDTSDDDDDNDSSNSDTTNDNDDNSSASVTTDTIENPEEYQSIPSSTISTQQPEAHILNQPSSAKLLNKTEPESETPDRNGSNGVGSHSLLSQLPPPVGTLKTDGQDDDEPIDLDNFNSVEELETTGLNRLKLALMTRGLKCGGTLKQRAERLFSIKGLKQDEIDPSLLAKPSKKK